MQKNAKKIGITIFVLVLIGSIVGSIIGIILYSNHKDEAANNTSLVVLSYDNRVYYGGDFSIQVAYKYADGSIEYPSPNTIIYESAESIINIDSNGKVRVVEDIYNGDTEYQEHPVVITISSSNKNVEPIQVSINVVPVNTYTITKYYYDKNTLELKSELVPAWIEQTVDEITSPTLLNYNFENWYVESVGGTVLSTPMTFHTEDKYLWGDNISIKPKFYANLQFNVDEMPISEEKPAPVKVYFDEPISNPLPAINSSLAGWSFDGWFTEVGGKGDENGIQNGVFRAAEPTLYAKWSGAATLNLTQIIHNDDNEGIVSREGTVGVLSASALVSVPVVYHGVINLASSQIPTYPEGGTFGGWYTGLYGAGEQITNELGVGIYNSKSLQLYDKIVFTVNIDYNSATGNYDEEHNEFTAIYGTVVDLVGNGLGINPTKTGWDFNGWQVVYGSDTFDVAENMPYTLLGDIKIVAQWKWEFKLNATIDDYSLEQNAVTIYYGKELSIQPLNDWGSWTFEGWYTQRAGGGKLIEQTADYENTGDKNLYAKWVLHKLTLNIVTPQVEEYQVLNNANIVYGKTIESSLGQSLPTPERPDGYSNGLGWFNGLDDDAEQITNSKTAFPKIMDVLYYKWTPRTYTVTFDHNGGSNGYLGSITATTGQKLPDLTEYVPTKYSYTFLGYYYSTEDNLYYGADMTGCKEWDVSDSDSVRLIALWGNPCEVTLDPVILLDPNYDDKEGSGSVKVRLGDSMPSGYIAPQRAGYTFVGFYEKENGQGRQYYDESMKSVNVWDRDVDSATIYANWEVNGIETSATSASLTMKNSGATGTTTISGQNGSGKYGFDVISTEHPNLKSPTVDSNGILTLITSENKDAQGKVDVRVTDLRTEKTANCEIKYKTEKEGCFAAGTFITMGDGTQKKIEDIKVGDIVMSWNFVTGQLEPMPVALYWYHGTSVYTVLNLEFSNGKILRIIAEHGLFDCDLNKYIFISEDNYAEFIGHSFVIYDGADGYNKTLLVNVYLTSEEVGSYSLRTACNDNAFAEGLLSLTAEDYPGYLTYFEVGENMKYDEEKMQADIELYGLFTYDDWLNDWSKYISYEEFIAFNGQYFKVLLGKGILTYEDILTLIDGLRNGPDIQS